LALTFKLGLAANAHAGLSSIPAWASCPTPPASTAQELDTHLQLAALIEQEWQARAEPVALISRSGLNLSAIAHRYSHAGFLRAPGLEASTAPPQVRQLYFDCDTAQPRVFDEGLAGFVRGVANDTHARFSVVWWPAAASQALVPAVSNDERALTLVSPTYQAQAHVWSLETQNCNQWLAEMLAAAFDGARDRATAQRWLREQGYTGSTIQLPWVGWLWAAALMPHMSLQDHPGDDLRARRFQVSMPESVERFVRQRWPQAERVEWCLRGREVVVRRGWLPLDEHCLPAAGDERKPLAH
jgi:hypothetical protein